HPLIALAISVAFASVLYYNHSIFRWVRIIVLVLSPFMLFTFGRAMGQIRHTRDIPNLVQQEVPTQKRLSQVDPTRSRIVWLLFDALDQQVLFSARPKGLEMPVF